MLLETVTRSQKKGKCRQSDLGSSMVLLPSAEVQEGDSIPARLTGAAGDRWTEGSHLDFVSQLLVSADNWDQMGDQR